MAGKGCPGLSVLLAAALIMFPLVPTGTARGAERVTPQITVKVGVLKGTLLDVAGNAVQKVTIAVLTRDGKAVATAVAGKDGTFSTKELAAGDYTLKVGENHPLAMKVAKEGGLSHLLIIVPSKPKYSAGAMTRVQRAWVVVGAVVVATGVTLPLVLSGDDDDETTTTTTTTTTSRRRRRRVSP